MACGPLSDAADACSGRPESDVDVAASLRPLVVSAVAAPFFGDVSVVLLGEVAVTSGALTADEETPSWAIGLAVPFFGDVSVVLLGEVAVASGELVGGVAALPAGSWFSGAVAAVALDSSACGVCVATVSCTCAPVPVAAAGGVWAALEFVPGAAVALCGADLAVS